MTAQEFVLIPKHIYIREQPHAARLLHDNSIKYKKPQLSYVNRVSPLKATTTTNPPVISSPETLINATADNNRQEQALLLTEDEGNELETSTEPNDTLSTKRITLQLQLMDKKKLKRAKKVLEIIKKSERVTINKENEELYVDKVPTGLKASVFLYDLQQQIKKLYNTAFLLIFRSLNFDEQLVMNIVCPKSRFIQRLRNKLNSGKEAEVAQISLVHLQPSFLLGNLRQQIPAQKA